MSNVLIETKGQGNKNQQKEEAVIVFEKDIKKMFPVDNHPHVKHSNKENVGNQKSKPSKFELVLKKCNAYSNNIKLTKKNYPKNHPQTKGSQKYFL